MRDILYPAEGPSEPDPMRRAQKAMARQPLPRRFFADVAIEERAEGHAIVLDGRPARTPGRNHLALPSLAAAELVAAEWRACADVIDPAAMHATRITNSAIDSVRSRLAEVRDDAAKYAGSDLVCYRAGEPEGLVASQNARWNPVVAWAAGALGARMTLVEGVIHAPQDEGALAIVAGTMRAEKDAVRVAALHVMTTLSGSCLIALMTASGALEAEAAWAASIVDEDWNASLWGRDAEAEARLARRKAEFMAAASLLAAIPGPAA